MNIAVYLASASGNDPALKEAVLKLGEWIGSNDHTLVYGGSQRGLMGDLADSVRSNNGYIIGVLPKIFMIPSIARDDLDELYVTEDISERRKKMICLSDAFIAFPGGTGTLEEISEVMSGVCLGQIKAPCILFNLDGYYEPLKKQLEIMVEKGLSSREKLQEIRFAENLEEIVSIITKEAEK